MERSWMFFYGASILFGIVTSTGEMLTVADGKINSSHDLVLPCGCQVTFTCNNTSPRDSIILWQVRKLHGIEDDQATAFVLTTNNLRISTKDSNVSTTFSRLTISGFTAADNGGIVTCYYLGKDRENKVHVRVDNLACTPSTTLPSTVQPSTVLPSTAQNTSTTNPDLVSGSGLLPLVFLALLIPLSAIVFLLAAIIILYSHHKKNGRAGVASNQPLESSRYVNVPGAQELGDKQTEETRDGLTYADVDHSEQSEHKAGNIYINGNGGPVEYTTVVE
jgi:hypothetical protein